MLHQVKDVKMVDLQTVVDDRGALMVAEVGNHVPFTIARVFAVSGVEDGGRRGGHAHLALNQLMVCLAGAVDVDVDDGEGSHTFKLDSPAQGLHVPPGLWAEQTYRGPDAVLLVLCDAAYDENDYLRGRAEFLDYRKKRTPSP